LILFSSYLSLRMVHSSPPRHTSSNMYKYLEHRNVLYNLSKKHMQTKHVTGNCSSHTCYNAYLAIKGHLPFSMICFSEKMCSCWRVSTMCFLRKHFRANVFWGSLRSWTCAPTRGGNGDISTSSWWNIVGAQTHQLYSTKSSHAKSFHTHNILQRKRCILFVFTSAVRLTVTITNTHTYIYKNVQHKHS